MRHPPFLLAVALVAACSPSPQVTDAAVDRDGAADGAQSLDAALADAALADAAATDDAAGTHGDAATRDSDGATMPECEWGGAPGSCLTLSACAAMPDHSSEAGSCPGPASIQCCIITPNTANNPPVPSGWKLFTGTVTADMTAWAVMILHDPVTYPMFSTTTKTFGTQLMLARVEWHPPDSLNSVIHRGVTLYVPV